MARWVTIGLLVALLVVGCASREDSAYVRDGIQYGVTDGIFRGRWWSYYERGASFAQGNFYDEATTDFETALINRSRDSWRARTYGLHFVPYFPNRELGIAYYYQGQFEEALDTLETALDMVDTARGHHYLGLTKRALISQGVLQDTQTPELQSNIMHGKVLTEPVVPLIVQAFDDTGVAQVRLNGRVLGQRSPHKSVSFQERLHLHEGVHEIKIAATDLADKEREETMVVTVDLTGPTIGLYTPVQATVVSTPTVFVEGVCVDNHGMSEIQMGDRVIGAVDGAKRLPFHFEAPLEPGENRITLTARDQAGNETRTVMLVYRDDGDSVASRLWLLQQRAPHRLVFAQANDDLLLSEAPPTPEDRIILRSPRTDRPNRHNQAVRVAGEVVTGSGVSELHINGQPFDQLTGAPREVFSRRIPIADDNVSKEGAQMVVAVQALDAAGHELREQVEVELRPVVLEDEEYRMPLAVRSFAADGLEASVPAVLWRQFTEALYMRQRFNLQERERLEAVLTEQELSAGLATAEQSLQLHRVVPAHFFLEGKITPWGSGGLEIKVDVISTETGLREATIDSIATDTTPEAIALACQTLATELEHVFPRLSGELLAIRQVRQSTMLFLDWTRADGLMPGVYAIVVLEVPEEYDDYAGKIESYLIPVGRVRIEEVTEENTRARPTHLIEEGFELEQGMAAITM